MIDPAFFLPWEEPVLPSAARHLAVRFAEGDNLSLGDAIVVLPGRRAGRRLVELLIEEAGSRDLVLSPPRITTIGGLPELLYEPSTRLADPAVSRHVYAEVLRSLPPERRSLVFPEPPGPDDLAGWLRLASVVLQLHRETAGEAVDFADVARECREGEGFDDGERWGVLAEAQRAYRRRLDEMGFVDRYDARCDALALEHAMRDRDVFLIGVVEMPAVVAAMLRESGSRVRPLVHAPAEYDEAFDDLGRIRTGFWHEKEVEIPDGAIAVCGRPPSQADATMLRLSGDGDELSPDEVTVGVPNEEVVPYLEQRFQAYGIPHRYAGGTPLSHTEPFRLLNATADYLEGTRFADFASLIRHPAVARLLDVPSPLEAADSHFNERLPARVAPTAFGTEGRTGGVDTLVRKLEDRLELGCLTDVRALGEWMESVLTLLRRAYGGRPLDRSEPRQRRIVEALEQIRDAATRLSRLPNELELSCSGAQALRAVLAEIREETVPPLADRAAVEMLGWLELHLDDAPVLVITGFDEDSVPASVSADPFLPDGLRSRLGLVDNERRYARDAYLLAATIASRPEVHLVVGRRNAEGDPLRPSRLLLATGGARLARRVRRLFDEGRAAPTPIPRLGVEPGDRSTFRSPPEPEITFTPPDSLRVTDFRTLLQDPYRWVLEQVFELEAVDDQAREMDPLQFGALAHEVLHRLGESVTAASVEPDLIRRSLDRLLDARAESRFAGSLPAVRLQVEQLRLRFAEFAEWHAARVAGGWETVAVEVGTPEGGLPLEVDGEPIGIRGRIDRVDRHRASGRWEVLDYKTSARASDPEKTHRKRGEWIDLQLPLYRFLVSGLAAEGRLPQSMVDSAADVDVGFVNLSRDGVARSLADWSPEVLESAMEAARGVVRAVRTGRVRYREDRSAPGGDAFGPLMGEGHLADPGTMDREAAGGGRQ